jgi:mannose-6-phosphate isomerase-like protein (cupin superfamily)
LRIEEPYVSHQPARVATNLERAFAAIRDYWSPIVIGELNDQQMKAVKFKGEFHWHRHTNEDEMFLVHRGRFRMEYRSHTVALSAGDFIIVPRGTEHRPVADEEVEVILFEPTSTVRTGD